MSSKTYTLKGLEPWIALVENQRVRQVVSQTVHTKQATLIALALSVAKWHPATKCAVDCGLCALRDYVDRTRCCECVLYKAGKGCLESGSPWRRFMSTSSSKEEKKYSRELYDLLVKLYAEEYRRVML